MAHRLIDAVRQYGRIAGLALAALAAAETVHAALITAGPPIDTLPPTLVDPLGSLSGGLQSGQFLVPIEVTLADDLQDWSFDLTFDAALVAPLEVGGLFGSVYQAFFTAAAAAPSDITSSGLLGTGVLQGIAGFASGVSGDGVLAFVLFERLPAQPMPEPGSAPLLAAALLSLSVAGLRRQQLSGIATRS